MTFRYSCGDCEHKITADERVEGWRLVDVHQREAHPQRPAPTGATVCTSCRKPVPAHIRHESYYDGNCRWILRSRRREIP